MKWSRAVQHLETLAGECARMQELPQSISPLRVVQLWAFGKVLDERSDLEWAQVALAVDLPSEDVPWLSVPSGATHWANTTRMAKNPIVAMWRSVHAPIWNHDIVRPVLLWDSTNGVAEDAFTAIRNDSVETVRIPVPSPDESSKRLTDELAISLRAVRDRVETYEDKRWSPGKLEPVADDLWSVTQGYLEILDATS